jgi:hypothetical protein
LRKDIESAADRALVSCASVAGQYAYSPARILSIPAHDLPQQRGKDALLRPSDVGRAGGVGHTGTGEKCERTRRRKDLCRRRGPLGGPGALAFLGNSSGIRERLSKVRAFPRVHGACFGQRTHQQVEG